MLARAFSLSLGLSCAVALTLNGVDYVPVPGVGYMRKDCVHSVPTGSIVEIIESQFHVTAPGAFAAVALPRCTFSPAAPLRTGTQRAVESSLRGRSLQLPPNYDGWISYAAYKDTSDDGFDSFVGNFSVPLEPAAQPEVLYLFPGLQNIDWIPKVDPEPTGDNVFDIIQPVLEFPNQMTGSGWSVRSWWVTLDVGAVASDELVVKPNDQIFGNMTRINAANDWFIGSTLSGKTTSVVARSATLGARLAKQPWAYCTAECYGCVDCTTLPPAGSAEVFSGMVLTQAGKVVVTPQWLPNPKPASQHFCKEAIAIKDPATIAITFA